jgi:hypothetical protein
MAGCWPGDTIRYREIKSELITSMQIYDQFRRSIFHELISMIPPGIDFQATYREFSISELQFTNKKNVIFFHKDILHPDEFDHWTDSVSFMGAKFMEVANTNPDINFVLIMGLENTHNEIQGKNIQIVRLGSKILDQKDQYQQLQPVIDKNFNSSQTFISLNRSPRQHRINLVSYLLGLNLESFGIISFKDSQNTASNWLERVSWSLTNEQELTKKIILCCGYDKIKQLSLSLNKTIDDLDKLYSNFNVQNFNVQNLMTLNFDTNLRYLYKNSFIEIVSETMFNLPHFGISEKFLHSVYGCNFPIMVAGQCAVKFLSELGFDMFDDIVDHSYDSISDPLDRLCASVDSNIKLLSDPILVKKLWKDNKKRFLNNVDFAKNIMYEKYRQRAIDEFKQVKWKI